MSSGSRTLVDSSFDSNRRRTKTNSPGLTRTRAGRTGNREGSGYQRHDGRSVTEAAVKRTAALKAVQENIPLPTERQAVGDYLTGWLDTTVRPSVRRCQERAADGTFMGAGSGSDPPVEASVAASC